MWQSLRQGIRHSSLSRTAHAGYLCEIDKNHPSFIRSAAQMVEKLYWERKSSLERAGLVISLDKLLDVYGY